MLVVPPGSVCFVQGGGGASCGGAGGGGAVEQWRWTV
ncbi:hypothetical protein Tco_1073143, partial [Tanacetum coccineum]